MTDSKRREETDLTVVFGPISIDISDIKCSLERLLVVSLSL